MSAPRPHGCRVKPGDVVLHPVSGAVVWVAALKGLNAYVVALPHQPPSFTGTRYFSPGDNRAVPVSIFFDAEPAPEAILNDPVNRAFVNSLNSEGCIMTKEQKKPSTSSSIVPSAAAPPAPSPKGAPAPAPARNASSSARARDRQLVEPTGKELDLGRNKRYIQVMEELRKLRRASRLDIAAALAARPDYTSTRPPLEIARWFISVAIKDGLARVVTDDE